jgi:hypothetical protein
MVDAAANASTSSQRSAAGFNATLSPSIETYRSAGCGKIFGNSLSVARSFARAALSSSSG